MKIKLLLAVFAIIVCACKSQKMPAATTAGIPQNALGPVIVYKMKADYSKKVPVTLSADKKKITSYPAPGDIYYKGQLAYPTPLANGYYLDNRGIGIHTGFTKYTYDEYSKLDQAPSLDELSHLLIDKDPFLVMYEVDRATGRDIEKINAAIKNKDFSRWKTVIRRKSQYKAVR